jgi:hypothetical protein
MLLQGSQIRDHSAGTDYFVRAMCLFQPHAMHGFYRAYLNPSQWGNEGTSIMLCKQVDDDFVVTGPCPGILGEEAHPDLSDWANEYVLSARAVLAILGDELLVDVALCTTSSEDGHERDGGAFFLSRSPGSGIMPDEYALNHVPGVRGLETGAVKLWDHLGVQKFEDGGLWGNFTMTIGSDTLLVRYDMEDAGAYELTSKQRPDGTWEHTSQITYIREEEGNVIQEMKALRDGPQGLFDKVQENFEFADAFPGLSSSPIILAGSDELDDGVTVFHFHPGDLGGKKVCARSG